MEKYFDLFSVVTNFVFLAIPYCLCNDGIDCYLLEEDTFLTLEKGVISVYQIPWNIFSIWANDCPNYFSHLDGVALLYLLENAIAAHT